MEQILKKIKSKKPRRSRDDLSQSKLKKYLPYYLMLLPLVVFLIVFCYLPMGGVLMAFEDFGLRAACSAANGSGWRTSETCSPTACSGAA